ncbi:hypothetical protein C8J56DRAFT_1081820 [Mycena floridula]|nr:hypothetical protein C8J56DRAFT_1081820 [Mycena floridula]
MPLFALVRQFRRQCKTTIDSPVSSAPVGQHVGHPVLESSNHQTRQDFPAVNVPSGSTADNSDKLSSGSVALSQHVEGVSMVLGVGDIYLGEEIESYLNENNVWRTRYKDEVMASSTRNISIWRYRGEGAAEVLEKTYKRYASLPRFYGLSHCRHQNILQLYGICRSPHFTALVFHGAPYFMDRRDYYESFPSSQWMTHYLKLAHNLGGICRTIETNTFIKEDLLDYYKFLFGMMFVEPVYHPPTLPSPLNQAAPFQLSHPEMNLPVYSLPGWDKFVFAVNGMDTTVDEAGIMLTLLPNMTIRCCIPAAQIATLRIFQEIQLFGQTNMSLFATWACQANHFIHDLPINIMNLQTELHPPWARFRCNVIQCWKKDTESSAVKKLQNTDYLYFFCHAQAAVKYWSEDEHAQHIIEDSLIQAAFGISVDCSWYYPVYHIPPQFYQILQTIHEACGFDPYCTQIAEYLGLPLVVTDDLHSGLEEYVEDSEHTSGSESGDSNYVSASEDA